MNDLVNGVPQDQKWLNIYDPFYECEEYCYDHFSRGILDMLTCFVWYNYSLESPNKNTIQGNVIQRGSASENLGNQYTRNHIVYNQFVKTYNAIMWKICEDDGQYNYDIDEKYIDIITPFM